MKQIELKPIRENPEQWDLMEKKLKELFRLKLYLPLIYELGGNKKLLKNSAEESALIEALLQGRVYFQQGRFVGKFSSAISKDLRALGAKWNGKYETFDIQKAKLPQKVKNAIEVSLSRFQQTARRVEKKLTEILPDEIAEGIRLEHIFDTAIYHTDNDFKKSIKGITVVPELTQEERARLSKEYSENLRLKIRGWMNDEILELRKKVEEQTFKGFRYDGLINVIQSSFQVSQRKAKFLARQETNLLLSKLKEIRYQDAGIREYKWRCVTGSPAHPVRPRHLQLNNESLRGKLFRFDDPPVSTDPGEPPRKCNPGEDYGCRCTAIPVVKFA